ncbi:MAG: RluA family pseudouridine synthase [Candidatus Omnitrophota bacterium]|jgi:RluA family pseudouridine synthase
MAKFEKKPLNTEDRGVMRTPEDGDFYIDTNIQVIHEDESLLVVNKPAPLAVHAVGSYRYVNLHNLLKEDARWSDCDIKLVHRLDAETSGVLVIAKDYLASRHICKQFMDGQVHKEYEAVVFGRPKELSGDITYALGYDNTSAFQRTRMRDDENGENAHTQYEVLASNQDYSHIKLIPLTGRTHQLRIHLALLGHPIVGDKSYLDPEIYKIYVKEGLGEAILKRLKLRRLCLHASQIRFTHPISEEVVTYHAPKPALIEDFVAQQNFKP